MRLNYTASDRVRTVIAGLGRVEDVKFSPDNSRLAVPSFGKNQIAIFDVCMTGEPHERKITLTDATEIFSPHLKYPHGIDFIDEVRIIVANREGDATIFELPRGKGVSNSYQLDPIGVLAADNFIHSPGAVSVIRKDQEICEVLLCNNYANKVTKHVIDLKRGCSLKSDEVLIKKWLDFPDGVSVNGKWIAISNHDARNVLLYDSSTPLHEGSDPDGILGYIRRPHGVRFTSDGRFILVADYEVSYLHVYMKDDADWRGVHSPLRSIRVMTDEERLPREGIDTWGPKGIDIDSSLNTLVTTCEVQPLVFFDFGAITQETPQRRGTCQEQASFRIKHELDRLHEVKQLTRSLLQLKGSLSYRITAPLRWVKSSLSRKWPG
jgi:hypothetical protein